MRWRSFCEVFRAHYFRAGRRSRQRDADCAVYREVLPREQQVVEFGAGRDVRRHDAAPVFQQPVCRAVRCAGVVAVGERRGGIRMGDGIPQFRKAGAGEIDRRLRHGGLQRRVGFGAASRGGAFPRLPGAGGDGRHQRYDVAPCRVAVRSLCTKQHHPRPHGFQVEKRLPDIFPGEVIEVPVDVRDPPRLQQQVCREEPVRVGQAAYPFPECLADDGRRAYQAECLRGMDGRDDGFARSIRPSASSTPVMRRPSVCRATTRLRTSIVPPCSRIFAASASAICCVPPVKRQAPSMFEWFTIAWW